MSNNFQSYSTYQAPAETAGHEWRAIQVHDTVHQVSTIDGLVTETSQRNDAGHSGELNPYFGTDSIFATARNPNGSPATEILPATLVTIGGVQGPVSFFVAEGILQKNQDGSFSPSTDAPQVVPETDPTGQLTISEQEMAGINAALAEVPQGNLEGLVATASGVAVGRLDSAALAERFAQSSGLDVADSQARIAAIASTFQQKAETALTEHGGLAREDLPEFFAWAQKHRQGPLQETVQRMLLAHDVSGFKSLASQWMAETPPSPNALRAAGLQVRSQGQRHEVLLRGSWMSPEAAARAGLI